MMLAIVVLAQRAEPCVDKTPLGWPAAVAIAAVAWAVVWLVVRVLNEVGKQ